MCAAMARPPWSWTSLTAASTSRLRRRGQGEGLAGALAAVRGQDVLLAEERLVAVVGLPQRRADLGARGLRRLGVGEEGDDVALLERW